MKPNKQVWINLFSRSGRTAVEVYKALDQKPDFIYTTHKWDHKNIMGKLRQLNGVDHRCIVTLMGYMYIIPADVCKMHYILNLHQADFDLYPQRKGKDPLERVFQEPGPHKCTNVIHEVIPEVDSGIIINRASFTANTLEEAHQMSSDIAVGQWVTILRRLI